MKTILLCMCGLWAAICSGAAEWRNVSPDGGRILHVAIDPLNPSTIYAASCAGLFKSVDSGVSWSSTSYAPWPYCQPFDPAAVTIDPRNAGTLYVSGCPGSKSTDGGATWHDLTVPSNPISCFRSMAFDPSNSATLYAAGGPVFKSTDGGDSWSAVSNSIGAVLVLVDPQNPSNVYAAGYGGFLKSRDAGATWTSVNWGLNGSLEALALDPLHSGTLYASTAGRIFRSGDGGASWQELKPGIPLPATGSAGFVKSIAMAVNPQGGTVYALIMHCFAETGGTPTYHFYLASSSDGGATWSMAGEPALSSDDFTAIAIDSTDAMNLYLSTSNGILRTRDGGSHWTRSNSGLKAVSLGSISAASGVVMAANTTSRYTTGAAVFRTANGGKSWDVVDLHTRVLQLEADPGNPSAVYAWSGTDLLKTEDAGVSWSGVEVAAIPNGTALAIDPLNSSILYKGVVTGNGRWDTRIYKSLDGGRTFARTDSSLSGTSCCSYVSQIAVNPHDSSTVYAGTADDNESGSGLWKSADGGATWSNFGWGDITGLALDPRDPNTVYTVWNCCVYKTSDGGRTWKQADVGLPNWPTGPLLIDPVNPNILYCVAYDYDNHRSDVFRSTDGAMTWHVAGSGLGANVSSISLDLRNPSILYAGTANGLYVLATDAPRSPRPVRK